MKIEHEEQETISPKTIAAVFLGSFIIWATIIVILFVLLG